jgi:predicted ATP-grasp superfamily ATP-dependent carboligase
LAAKIVPTGDIGPFCLAFGYSTRALTSALGAVGFRVISVDAFGDSDIQDFAEQTLILPGWGDRRALLSLKSHLDCCRYRIGSRRERVNNLPVFLAGGCENWLTAIGFLARRPELKVFGPSVSQIKKIRSPHLWMEAASFGGVGFPESFFGPNRGVKSDWRESLSGQWLIKPIFGAGGASINRIECSGSGEPLVPELHYLQREIPGRVLGATCIAGWSGQWVGNVNDPGINPSSHPDSELRPTCTLVGVTESWSHLDFPGPKEFSYRGSWGPITLPPVQRLAIERVAQYLAEHSGICGWLQMDFIEDVAGRLWLLEVNPRWSAGMEVLVRSGWSNPVIAHSGAWGLTVLSHKCGLQTGEAQRSVPKLSGKYIFYLSERLLLSDRLVGRLNELSREEFADIPSQATIGTPLPAGAPLLTILADIPMSVSEAESRCRLYRLLCDRAEALKGLLAASR